ncbi:MAG: hypothetical protein ACXVWF_02395 [Actinomycetota bacterium]
MLSVGFPRMHKEARERRDYLPPLVGAAAALGLDVVVETGIGSGMDLRDADYTGLSPNIRAGTNAEAFACDVVVTLRSPENDEFTKLRRGATLVSMLHFPTRPARVAELTRLGIAAIALDCIRDESGTRLVVNASAVAWNGVEAAFDALEATWPALQSPERGLIEVLVLGAGAIGRHAVDAATKLGSWARRDAYMAMGYPGVMVRCVGRNVTADARLMRALFRSTDVVVDATQRDDTWRPLVPNAWIEDLPRHAVVCDLVVDPYLPDADPPTVRSIEGIPRGNLDKHVFAPTDPDWCDTIPAGVPTGHRRLTVTCYSWPGVRPRECMELYGAQLTPLLECLLARGGAERLRPDGTSQERSLLRGYLPAWIEESARAVPTPTSPAVVLSAP